MAPKVPPTVTPKGPPKVLPKLPPVDPTVFENADPWVKVLFDHVAHLGNRFDNVDESLSDYKEKVDKAIEQQTKTAEEVEQLQTDVDEIRSDMVDAQGKMDKLQGDFRNFQIEVDKKFEDLKAAFEAKSSVVTVKVPTLTAAQQCSVEDKFQALLGEAKAMQAVFVVGKIRDMRQTVPLPTLVKRHFEAFGAKLYPTVGKGGTARFSVAPDKIEDVKCTIRHYNMAIRDLGWWVVQDAPPALRRMNSNAYTFFKMARDQFSLIRQFRFEAENGYLTMNDRPFLPVYLVPNKRDSWKKLAALINELVIDYVDTDWLTAVTSEFVVPENFGTRWCQILREHEKQHATEEFFLDENNMETATGMTASGGG
jgi:hypothetical protein